ncbi:MAG: hypothetical protein KGI59_01925 [Patescibacteria group bacterium]|nr:hypothetical protein [Patescibacteria group bacterium]MDE2172656.1 hypothetical protein [Patescibacteria group bacterium]
MTFIRALYSMFNETFLEALFPQAEAEKEVLSLAPAEIFRRLPRASEFPTREACSVFAYADERVWRLIWALKYKKSRTAADICGHALLSILSLYLRAVPGIIIIPMPITSKRRRERGFNQCELIADAIEKLWNLSQPDAAEKASAPNDLLVVRDLLLRTRHKARQTLKDRSERLENAENLFAVNDEARRRLKPLAENGKYLLLVIDDVVTTGSTINDAIMTIRGAGLTNCFGLSVAH